MDVPKIMGILNLTKDSFYDGGKNNTIDKALFHTEKMINEGAFFIDVGAASSKPGNKLITLDEEKKILLPIFEKLIQHFPKVLFSIDTYNSSIANACLKIGASIINDVSGGVIDLKMHQTVAQFNAPYVMMHMQGKPEKMQQNPNYTDLIPNVLSFFSKQIKLATNAGVQDVIVDPGFGFGKNTQHNFGLLKHYNQFKSLKCPLLMGVSRKSMIYELLNTIPENALNGTTALHAWGLEKGAQILRVHDVKEAKECVDLWMALK
jgi:dihydropteroate synthase